METSNSSLIIILIKDRKRRRRDKRKYQVVRSYRLRFFSHLARTVPVEDHHRIRVATLRPPAD